MARSFRKNPGWSDGNQSKKSPKRWANRRVRHTKEIDNFCFYKRLYSPWRITDYNCRYYSAKSFWEWCKNCDWLSNKLRHYYRGVGK
jgi:hypothetical protein